MILQQDVWAFREFLTCPQVIRHLDEVVKTNMTDVINQLRKGIVRSALVLLARIDHPASDRTTFSVQLNSGSDQLRVVSTEARTVLDPVETQRPLQSGLLLGRIEANGACPDEGRTCFQSLWLLCQSCPCSCLCFCPFLCSCPSGLGCSNCSTLWTAPNRRASST